MGDHTKIILAEMPSSTAFLPLQQARIQLSSLTHHYHVARPAAGLTRPDSTRDSLLASLPLNPPKRCRPVGLRGTMRLRVD